MAEELPGASGVNLDCDRRTSERAFLRRRTARLEIEGTRYDLQLLDESEGGLGVYCGTRLDLPNGASVLVHVDGQEPRKADVRYIRPHSHGGYHVGLQWTS